MKKLEKALQKGFVMMTLVALCVTFMGSATTMAAELEGQEVETEVSGSGSGDQADPYNMINPNGEVAAFSVSLRAAASSSARVLALMYEGEEVIIDGTGTVVNSDGVWYYLKHVRTGKWGYASARYIVCWNAG